MSNTNYFENYKDINETENVSRPENVSIEQKPFLEFSQINSFDTTDTTDTTVKLVIDTVKLENTDSNNIDSNNIDGGILYEIIHIFDDLCSYSRTIIENNYFNFSSTDDFNLVYPHIYIGNYSTSTNLELLKDLGITNIISVIPSFNPPYIDKFNYLHIQAYDDEFQDMSRHFEATNEYIAKCLNEGGKILIHCMAGRSRSITIFISFLIHIIHGKFNQCIINLDKEHMNTISNIIDYRKYTERKLKSSSKNIDVYINDRNDNGNGNGNGNNYETISRIEHELPRLTKKEASFILYKNQKMIDDINELSNIFKIYYKQIQYFKIDILVETEETTETIDKLKQKLSNCLMKEILMYVKSHREIASPNISFIKQLTQSIF